MTNRINPTIPPTSKTLPTWQAGSSQRTEIALPCFGRGVFFFRKKQVQIFRRSLNEFSLARGPTGAETRAGPWKQKTRMEEK
jgi:hypothetical protein